jgi:single-strand DNA-binding protein
MANVNIVILAGNLTADPELRYTPSGAPVCRLRMAVNRRYKDPKTNELREEATFVDVDVFGKQAEAAGQYLTKGRPLLVEGRLRLDQWEDKQTGQKRSRLKVVANRVQFMGPPPAAAPGAPAAGPRPAAAAQPAPPAPAAAQPSQPEEEQSQASEQDLDVPQEGIPF